MAHEEEISFEEYLNKETTPSTNANRYKASDVYKIKVTQIPKYHEVKKKTITYTTQQEFDFLKYYGIVEYYAVKVMFKGEITFKELKMLLFLYSEHPFTITDFKDYTELVGWKTNRLRQWVKKGIVVEHKVKKYKGSRTAKLYKLSMSTKRKIRAIYDKLLLRYKITEEKTHNPLFREKSRTYQEKRYAKKIKQMNAGVYGKAKDESDYDDLNDLKFFDVVKEHNKNNHETLPNFKAAEEEYKKIKENKDVE